MQQRKELRQAGLKVTLPRLKILEILEDSKLRHMSAEDIYKHLLTEGEEIGHEIAAKRGYELLDHSLVLYVRVLKKPSDS